MRQRPDGWRWAALAVKLKIMSPQPIYRANDLRPSYKLRYSWSGWPSTGKFPDVPPKQHSFWQDLDAAWDTDGLRRLEGRWTAEAIQYTFSVLPHVSPMFFAARVKGRLQHALRVSGRTTKFSRKVGFRTIGDNHRHDVEAYIERQVEEERFVDPRFQNSLRKFTVVCPEVDLSKPTETRSGRYWYNLHLVLVTQHRYRIVEPDRLATLRDMSFKIGMKKEYEISRLAVLPDHLHLSLRGNIEHSPEEIALAYLNNLAYAMGQNAIWQRGYYAGTFGEYDLDAVRRKGD